MSKSLKELKSIIENDIICNEKYLKSSEGNQNPQVKEMYTQAKIRIETLKDVLYYIKTGGKAMFEKIEE